METMRKKYREVDDIRCMNPSFFDWEVAVDILSVNADRFGLIELSEILDLIKRAAQLHTEALYVNNSDIDAILSEIDELTDKKIIATKLSGKVNGNLDQLKAEFNILCLMQSEGLLLRIYRRSVAFASRSNVLAIPMNHKDRQFLSTLYNRLIKFYKELLTTYTLLSMRYS